MSKFKDNNPSISAVRLAMPIRKFLEQDANLSIETLKLLQNTIFRCPICLDMMIDPVAVECCLHRFCRECISRYLQQLRDNRDTKKICPLCKLNTTHRKLKPDSRLDGLMNIIQAALTSSHAITASSSSGSNAFDLGSPRYVNSTRYGEIDTSLLKENDYKVTRQVLDFGRKFHEEQLLKIRLAQRQIIEQKEMRLKTRYLNAAMIASFENNSGSSSESRQMIQFQLIKNPCDKQLSTFPFEYVQSSVETTIKDVKKLIHALNRSACPPQSTHEDVRLSILSPSLGPVVESSAEATMVNRYGCYQKYLYYPINDELLTLQDIELFIKSKNLRMTFLFELLKSSSSASSSAPTEISPNFPNFRGSSLTTRDQDAKIEAKVTRTIVNTKQDSNEATVAANVQGQQTYSSFPTIYQTCNIPVWFTPPVFTDPYYANSAFSEQMLANYFTFGLHPSAMMMASASSTAVPSANDDTGLPHQSPSVSAVEATSSSSLEDTTKFDGKHIDKRKRSE